MGISLFAVNSKNPYTEVFREAGVSVVDERRIFLSRVAEMALSFSKSVAAPQSFFINGGTAKTVSDIAISLLGVCRFVFAETRDFDFASELVLDRMGVPLKRKDGRKCVEISLCEGDVKLFWEDTQAHISDFRAEVYAPFSGVITENLLLPLVSLFEICGIFAKNEIKIAYLIK